MLRERIARFFWLFRSIGFNAFGKKSLIFRPMRIIGKAHIEIGKSVTILNNARIEVKEENSRCVFLKIGDYSSFGQNLHLIANQNVTIGSNVVISSNVFISDLHHDYSEPNINALDKKCIIIPTIIGDYSFVGFGAVIMPGVNLGKNCVVGANSVVLKGNYGDGVVLAGVPAKIIKKYNQATNKWEKVS